MSTKARAAVRIDKSPFPVIPPEVVEMRAAMSWNQIMALYPGIMKLFEVVVDLVKENVSHEMIMRHMEPYVREMVTERHREAVTARLAYVARVWRDGRAKPEPERYAPLWDRPDPKGPVLCPYCFSNDRAGSGRCWCRR